jgi:diguanylate cyclase (GGDEF)-like protein
VDIAGSMEEINRQVSDVLAIFQITDYDLDRYQSLIERAREELLNISFDTVQKLMVQKQEIEDLKEEVTKDGITLLYNHRSFHQMMLIEMQRAVRYRIPMSILMADIDNFKSVNDRYGHLAGDKVIKMVSKTLASHIRETDIVGRYGGEEFAVVCTNTSREGAVILSDRLREAVAAGSVTHDGQTVAVTISIGVTSMEAAGEISKEELIQQADNALYHAKMSGKNRCFAYSREGVIPSHPLSNGS